MIRASNLHKLYKLNERYIRNLARDILKIIGKEGAIDLELVFLDDKSIKIYNKKYKSEDRATDVLSFGIDRSEFGRKTPIGQIIISLDTALRNSRLYSTDFAEEITLYIIHGILHLFGYDDESKIDSRKMAARQKQILDKLWCSKNLSKVLMPQ